MLRLLNSQIRVKRPESQLTTAALERYAARYQDSIFAKKIVDLRAAASEASERSLLEEKRNWRIFET